MADDGAVPSAIDNARLDALWDSVVNNSASASASASGTKRGADDFAPLGVALGDTSFEVPELRSMKRGRILPEDGTYTEPGKDPSEGGRYGPRWREEMLTRKKVLEDSPDYKFLTLVAGYANTTVERLVDDDSLNRAFRLRLAEVQARFQAEEVKLTAESLEGTLVRLAQAQAFDRERMGRIAERRRSDEVLLRLPQHTTAVHTYIDAQRANVDRVATDAVLELGRGTGFSVPATREHIFEHAAIVLLDGPASGQDDPDVGFAVISTGGTAVASAGVTAQMLIRIAFGDASSGRSVLPDVTGVAMSMREALALTFRNAFDRMPTFAPSGFSADLAPVATDRTGPATFRVALQRMLVLQRLARASVLEDEREAEVLAFVQLYRSDSDSAVANFLRVLDGPFLLQARVIARGMALKSWLNELTALVDVLSTAFALHDAESLLRAPRAETGHGDDATPRTVIEIAREAGQRERERALLSGMSQERAEASARAAARAVLDNPPNHIFSVSASQRREVRQAIETAAAVISGLDQSSPMRVAKTLLDLGVSGAHGLEADTALWAAAQEGEASVATGQIDIQEIRAQAPSLIWSDAMAWYEQLGGSLFFDRESWSIEAGIPILVQGVNFPSPEATRAIFRGGSDVFDWHPPNSPPSQISTQMRALWELYTPSISTILAKLSPRPEPPSLTRTERVIFTTMSGGTPPEKARLAANEFAPTRWVLFVFMARLLETDMAVTSKALSDATDQREKLITSTRERIDAMLRGVPQVRPVVEPPYQHRRGWVDSPENSGVITIVPHVVAGIKAAWDSLAIAAPHIVQNAGSVETLQNHPDLSGDFAELVAAHMARFAQRNPTRYVQLGQRAHNTVDMINIIDRFRYNYTLDPAPPPSLLGTEVATAASRVRVTKRALGHQVRRSGFVLL